MSKLWSKYINTSPTPSLKDGRKVDECTEQLKLAKFRRKQSDEQIAILKAEMNAQNKSEKEQDF